MQLTGPVAFTGTGLMGTPMIKRLLGAGFAVRVWNRTASKVAEVVAAGAVASPTIAEACDGAQVVCTCLSNANAVEQVVFAAQGVVAAARPPAMLVDFSTIGPVATLRSRRVLPRPAARRGSMHRSRAVRPAPPRASS